MRRTLAFIATIAVSAFMLGGGPSEVAAETHTGEVPSNSRKITVSGTLATEVVPCSSLCTKSAWFGSLAGSSGFTLITLEDAGIPKANMRRFHGSLVLSTAQGNLIGEDLGVWNLDTGTYVDFFTVTSGTGAFSGATAEIILSGTLDPVTGKGFSQYHGVITTNHRQ